MKLLLGFYLCLFSVVAFPQSHSERSRYLRPSQHCNGRRCSSESRNGRPGGDWDDYSDSKSALPEGNRDKNKPITLGRDDWPSSSTGGRPGIGSDYKPKPPGAGGGSRHGEDSKQDSGYGSEINDPRPGGNDDYYPKPVSEKNDDYFPKPVPGEEDKTDDYYPKPVSGEDSDRGTADYNPKPVPHDDRWVDESKSKLVPSDRDRNKPDTDYYPKPVPAGDKDDNENPKDSSGGYKNPNDEINEGSYDEAGRQDDRGETGVDRGNCICVPYYQCTDGHIVTDGAGIIDARKKPEPEEELPLDGKFKPPSCGPFHVCCNTPETSTVKPYEHRCGVRNPSGINSRILSPSSKGEADFGEWPWQAAILKSEGTVNIFQCGGVLIDKYHVITVAHCVFHLYKYSDYSLKVRLGEWDTQSTNEFLAHEDYRVAKISIHPEYRNNSLWNDIAILKLTEEVPFQPHIDTVCLPKHDESFAGQNCIVTGWGKDAYKGGTFSNVMKEVALPVIDNYKCEEMLRKTRLGRFFQLFEGFMCAGGGHGVDSCKGDGGGPLVCYRKDRSYALAGIVSWGIDCGQPGVPGVYVKIQKYLEWISKITGYQLQEYWPNRSYGG